MAVDLEAPASASGATAGTDGADTFSGVERVTGTSLSDDLRGNTTTVVANVLSGMGGDDLINVKDAKADDTADGGTGTDTCTVDTIGTGVKKVSCP